MSGFLRPIDETCEQAPLADVEVREGRQADLGPMAIARVLPTKGRRTIGAWCFTDLMTPGDLAEPLPLEIGPHPHIGLATVTWLFGGAALHGDSLGTEQLIRPGELNLMTAGGGIAHAELGMADEPVGHTVGAYAGAQLWIAQPEATRHGESRFQHLAAVPEVHFSGGVAKVLVGDFADVSSPAVVDSPLVGLDLSFGPSVVLPAVPTFEYGVVPVDRPIRVHDTIVEPGSLAIVPTGFEHLPIDADGERSRVLVLGGEPLGEPIEMWWNFVARSKDEITAAWRDWRDHNDERFGPVPSDLPRIDAPVPLWVRE